MKLLIFLTVLAVAGAFLYWRLRPYVATARRVLGIMRDVRRVSTTEYGAPVGRSNAASEKLVRCQACGTWIPSTRAVSPGRWSGASNVYYCSHACMERIAEGRRPKAAGGKHL